MLRLHTSQRFFKSHSTTKRLDQPFDPHIISATQNTCHPTFLYRSEYVITIAHCDSSSIGLEISWGTSLSIYIQDQYPPPLLAARGN